MVLLVDNYDSFTYNLYQLIGEINPDVEVFRNDRITVAEIVVKRPSHIVLSPGPGRPADAGICEKVVKTFTGHIPILGVCLGHQAICEVSGATVTYAPTLMHGKASVISLNRECPVFAGLPEQIKGARYHSLAAKKETIPRELLIRAESEDRCVMAVEHFNAPVFGIQFHPESILTEYGGIMMKNFLNV
jgi:anthranilate synthase component 2